MLDDEVICGNHIGWLTCYVQLSCAHFGRSAPHIETIVLDLNQAESLDAMIKCSVVRLVVLHVKQVVAFLLIECDALLGGVQQVRLFYVCMKVLIVCMVNPFWFHNFTESKFSYWYLNI